jgi:hypothetical protein
MSDPMRISYLKGEISFEDYANFIENENLKDELNENVLMMAPATGLTEDQNGTSFIFLIF